MKIYFLLYKLNNTLIKGSIYFSVCRIQLYNRTKLFFLRGIHFIFMYVTYDMDIFFILIKNKCIFIRNYRYLFRLINEMNPYYIFENFILFYLHIRITLLNIFS